MLLISLTIISCGGAGSEDSNDSAVDTEPPSVPAGLTLTVVSSSQIDLSWTASSDNTGVSGYSVYRDNTELHTTTSIAFSNINLEPDTRYCYDIAAYDSFGNESSRSSQSCATTDSVPSSWSISTIDSAGDVGLGTSIATGSVHISYYDSTNNQLKYARYSSGTWSMPVSLINMGSIAFETTFSALALNSSENIYIGYYDASTVLNGDLRLITCSADSDCSQSANWDNIIIDSAGDVGSDTSMYIDLVDNIHISYYDSMNGHLKYASCLHGNDCNQGDNWTTSIIDSSGDVGQYSSISVDSNGNIHISYYDSAGLFSGHLKYASCTATNDCAEASNWNIVIIDDSGDAGQYSSIAVDPDNNIHISYYDFNNGNLKYALCFSSDNCTQASNWNTMTVDNAADVGDYSSIAADSQGNMHISYHDFNNDRLKYAVCSSAEYCAQSNNWGIFIVDDTAHVGEFTSIAADANNIIHISYYDSENGDLKYAVKQ